MQSLRRSGRYTDVRLSRQVGFAVRIGVIGKNEGQLMLSELERELNQLYSEVYQEIYDKKEVGKEE